MGVSRSISRGIVGWQVSTRLYAALALDVLWRWGPRRVGVMMQKICPVWSITATVEFSIVPRVTRSDSR